MSFASNIGCRFCLTLFLFFDGGQPLLLSFGSLALCFGVGCRFCLTLFLFCDLLLLRFHSLKFRFGLGCRFCLALYLFFEPLLLGFLGLALAPPRLPPSAASGCSTLGVHGTHTGTPD